MVFLSIHTFHLRLALGPSPVIRDKSHQSGPMKKDIQEDGKVGTQAKRKN